MGLFVHGTHSGDCLWDSADCLFMGLKQLFVYGTSSSVGHGIVCSWDSLR